MRWWFPHFFEQLLMDTLKLKLLPASMKSIQSPSSARLQRRFRPWEKPPMIVKNVLKAGGRQEGTWIVFFMYFMPLPVTVSCNCFLLYMYILYTSDLVQIQSAFAASCYQGEGMDPLEWWPRPPCVISVMTVGSIHLVIYQQLLELLKWAAEHPFSLAGSTSVRAGGIRTVHYSTNHPACRTTALKLS